jgi:LacI family transcriptional regulator
MGYTPNFMARNLSSKKTNTIGVVVPKIAHFFFGSIIDTLYDLAFKSGYEIILTVSRESEEREKKQIQTLLSMKVDGIIISVSKETKDYSIFDSVKKNGVPIVFMDRIPNIKNINKVLVDDRVGAYAAVEHMIKIGYKKIGHFAGYPDLNIGYERYSGFVDAMKKHNIPINNDWVCKGGFGELSGYESFMKLYKANNLPEAILTVTYPVALGVYRAVQELGLNIPNDIDLICFSNTIEQNYLSPPLSCVDQVTSQIASKSMEILLNNILNPDIKKGTSVKIPTKLIIRGTCVGK